MGDNRAFLNMLVNNSQSYDYNKHIQEEPVNTNSIKLRNIDFDNFIEIGYISIIFWGRLETTLTSDAMCFVSKDIGDKTEFVLKFKGVDKMNTNIAFFKLFSKKGVTESFLDKVSKNGHALYNSFGNALLTLNLNDINLIPYKQVSKSSNSIIQFVHTMTIITRTEAATWCNVNPNEFMGDSDSIRMVTINSFGPALYNKGIGSIQVLLNPDFMRSIGQVNTITFHMDRNI